jgi:hypothetical protein
MRAGVNEAYLTGARDLDQIALDYLGGDIDINPARFNHNEYFFQGRRPTFFESQLPLVIIKKLLRHAVFATA